MPEPLYRRIAEDLLQKIESGEIPHGAQLPTEIELRDAYDASRNTVRDAVKWLITRGEVETRPGQGTFVIDKIDPFVTLVNAETGFGEPEGATYASEVSARLRKPSISEPRVEVQAANALVASELGLDDGANVVSRHQRRFIDGTPWSLQTTFYPMRFVQAGATKILQAEDMPDGVVRYIEEELGIKHSGWRDRILVRAPTAGEANFFKLPDDGRVAIIQISRTGFAEDLQPIRLTITVYPADRNEFVIPVGRVPEDAFTVTEDSRAI